MSEKAKSKFSDTGYVDNENTNAKVEGKAKKAKEEFTQNKKTADTNIKDITDLGYETSTASLNPTGGQGANYALTGGQWGRLNDRDYSKTLQLARNVDAYNAQPLAHRVVHNHWKAGGLQDLGTGIEKPNLQTMETRAMEQTFGLDTAQKTLSQQLQAAINNKDLDLFKQSIAQLYNINMTDYQAQNLMTQLTHQAEIQQIMLKDMDFFKRAFGAETAATLFNVMQDDQMYAATLGKVLLGDSITPQLEEYLQDRFIMQRQAEYEAQGIDSTTAYQKAVNDNDLYTQQLFTQAEANTKRAQNVFAKLKAWDQARKNAKTGRQR